MRCQPKGSRNASMLLKDVFSQHCPPCLACLGRSFPLTCEKFGIDAVKELPHARHPHRLGFHRHDCNARGGSRELYQGNRRFRPRHSPTRQAARSSPDARGCACAHDRTARDHDRTARPHDGTDRPNRPKPAEIQPENCPPFSHPVNCGIGGTSHVGGDEGAGNAGGDPGGLRPY